MTATEGASRAGEVVAGAGSALTVGERYPLDYMDRGCLVAMSREHGCSNAPTWEFGVRGSLDPEACRRALQDLMCRYPICRSRIRPTDPRRASSVSLCYAVDEPYEVSELFTYVDLEGQPETALEELRRSVRDRYLDPFVRYPFHLTLARLSDDACRLIFQQHHAIADARAFISLLEDFGELLEHAIQGTRPAPEKLANYGKHSELEALRIGRGRAFWWALQGLWVWARVTIHSLRNPIEPSIQNLSKDYTGSNGTVHLEIESKRLDEWKTLRHRHGVSLTALLASAFFLANRRWNVEHGVPQGNAKVSLIAETRPREGDFQSFANHLGGLFGELSMRDEPDPLEMMRSLHEQLRRQVRNDEHKKRLLFERVLTRFVPIEVMRKAVFEVDPTMNLNFSNVIAIDFPRLEGRTWCAEDVWITTPTMPPFGVLLTVVDYNGQLRFNFNHKASIVTRPQAARLVELFEAALGEVTEALAR